MPKPTPVLIIERRHAPGMAAFQRQTRIRELAEGETPPPERDLAPQGSAPHDWKDDEDQL